MDFENVGERELDRGKTVLQHGDLKQAAELFAAAARNLADPASRSEATQSLLLIAKRYDEAGQDREALDVYMKVLDVAPSVRAYLAVAQHVPRHWGKAWNWANARWQLRSCTSVGHWVRVRGRIHVENRGEVAIGERVQFLSHYARTVLAVFPGGRLEVGDRTVVNYGVDIAATKLVQIGADCLIGTHVIILDNDFHELTERSKRPEGRPVVIADGAWIGNRAIVLAGVTIGEQAAIGAGSVVMTDIPSYSLAMGNPARVVKKF